MKTVEDPASDALGGEWTVMALARSGEEVDETILKNTARMLKKELKNRKRTQRKSIYRVLQGSSGFKIYRKRSDRYRRI